MPRPNIPASNAHDLRFEPYNYFPAHYSSTQHTRMVNFEHYPARDEKTYKVNMSEPLFDREKHLNLYKPKATGILQFGKMEPKRSYLTPQQKYTPPQDPIMPSLEGHSRKKAILAILAASNKKNDLEKQEKIPEILHKVPAPLIDKMKPRTEKRTEDVLPVYMQVGLTYALIMYRITTVVSR